MNKKIIHLLIAPLLVFSSVSCGTFAGMGRDIQAMGKSMENAEHNRIWANRKARYQHDPNAVPYPPVAPH